MNLHQTKKKTILSIYGSYLDTDRIAEICRRLGKTLAKHFPEIILLNDDTGGVVDAVERAFSGGKSQRMDIKKKQELISKHPRIAILIGGHYPDRDAVLQAHADGTRVFTIKSSYREGIYDYVMMETVYLPNTHKPPLYNPEEMKLIRILGDTSSSPKKVVGALIKLIGPYLDY